MYDLLIVLAILIGIVFLIVIHEFGHFLAAKLSKVKVTDFFVGFGPKLFSFQKGETTYGVRAILLGGYVKMSGMDFLSEEKDDKEERSIANASLTKKIFIVVMGSVMNVIAAFLILAVALGFIGAIESTNFVKKTFKGKPAYGVILAGDKIIAINKKPVKTWGKTVKEIKKYPNKNIVVTVVRKGNEKNLYLKATSKNHQGFIGVETKIKQRQLGFFEAIEASYKTIIFIVTATTAMIFKAVSGQPAQLAKNSSSIVGVVDVGRRVINSVFTYLYFIGYISVALAYVNLLPIPPLDAGRALIFIIEKIKRKPLSKKTLIAIMSVGLAILLPLMVYLFLKDLYVIILRFIRYLTH